jgi:hypothetical protein
MNQSEYFAAIRAANPKVELCRVPNGSWHLVRNIAKWHCGVGGPGNSPTSGNYIIEGWTRRIVCHTHHTPLGRNSRIEATLDLPTLSACLQRNAGLCPIYEGHSFCALCLDHIRFHARDYPMTCSDDLSPESIDSTKPLIVCSDGSLYQAATRTLAAANQLAKEKIGNSSMTATIFAPHTKLERPLPPVKATRIKCS